MLCFLCETNPADSRIDVTMSRIPSGSAREYRRVTVPVCASCKAKDLSATSSNLWIAIALWILLVIGGTVIWGWGGTFAGFAVGFLVALAFSTAKKPSRALQHEDVKALEAEGFRAGG